MRADLRKSLDAIFANCENQHVTGVTGVATGISGRNRQELRSVTGATSSDLQEVPHVTANPVTYEKPNGHNGYAGYASKTAIPQLAEGAGVLAPCASEIGERAAIIADGDGCGDLEAEQRALEAVGIASWQLVADAWRRKVSDALTFAPLPRTPEGRRLLIVSRKFLASPWHDLTVRLGWDVLSLYGVWGDPLTAGKQHLGLVVWLALSAGSKLEKLTADCAQVRKPCGKVEIYNRFDLLMNEDAELWWQSRLIIGGAGT